MDELNDQEEAKLIDEQTVIIWDVADMLGVNYRTLDDVFKSITFKCYSRTDGFILYESRTTNSRQMICQYVLTVINTFTISHTFARTGILVALGSVYLSARQTLAKSPRKFNSQ